MMRRLVLFLLGIAGLVAASPDLASAHYHGSGPGGEPITQALLEVSADGTILLTKPVWKEVAYQYTVNVEVPETVVENGKPVTKKKTVQETRTATRRIAVAVNMNVPEEEIRLFDTTGKEVPLAAARTRLRRPTLVLMTADGKLHPSFVPLFKKDALVLEYSPPPVIYSAPGPGEAAPLAPPAAVPPAAPPTSTSRPSARQLPVQLVRQEKAAPKPEPAYAESPFPEGLAPTFRYCKVQDQGKVVAVRHFFEWKKSMTMYRNVSQDGVEKKVPYEVVMTTGADETIQWDRGMVKFLDFSGKPLAATRISAMTQEAAVVASADGEPVDKFWLQNINPDATVIVLPRVSYWQAQPPTPVGPAPTAPATLPTPEA